MSCFHLFRKNQQPQVPNEHALLGEGAIYAERRLGYNSSGLGEENLKNTLVVSMREGPYAHEHDYTSTLHRPLPPHHVTFQPHYEPQHVQGHGHGEEGFPDIPGVNKVPHHVYETPMLPEEVSVHGIRTQSADGISRKLDPREDRRKNYTN